MSPIAITLCFLAFAMVMFVWEKIPLAVTAMIVCVGLVLFGVLDIKTAFAGFSDSNVVLFVAMFVLSGALFETGAANRIGGLVNKFAKTERQTLIAVMVLAGLMSSVLSNTGTTAIFIPIVVGICMKAGFMRPRLLMPIAFASSLGANMSIIGMPGNMVAQGILVEGTGNGFSFFEFAKVGFPIMVAGILYFVLFGYRLLPTHTKLDDENVMTPEEQAAKFAAVPAWKQNTAIAVLILTILAMVFEKQIGIKFQVSGCIGALILVVTKVISEKDAYKSIDSPVIFLFAGVLSLAKALETTGAGKMIADTIMEQLGGQPDPFTLLTVLIILSAVLTNFMSNTATVALLGPIALQISEAIGADPKAVLVAVVIGSSCAYATPIGMPANALVLSAGGYRFVDYVKAGLPLIIVCIIMSLLLLPMMFPFFPA